MRLANLSAYLTARRRVAPCRAPSFPGLADAAPNMAFVPFGIVGVGGGGAASAAALYFRKSRSGCHVVIKGRGVAGFYPGAGRLGERGEDSFRHK